jgi:RNA polymerase sigma-70 factor (ECF subfamily)
MNATDVVEAIADAHQQEWARVVAAMARRFGDLDIAEEAAAEAFATAVERWPVDGVPPSPGAWLTTTAHRKAIDRIRRENKRDDKQREARRLYDDNPPEPLGAIDDERLRLIFTCCHPALGVEARVALTLRMVGGLTVPEIARAFLVQEATLGQRITPVPSRRSRLLVSRTGCRPRKTCRAESSVCSPSSSWSSTRATWRAVRTPTLCVPT